MVDRLKVITHSICGWRCVALGEQFQCDRCRRLMHQHEVSAVDLPNPFATNTARSILLKPSRGGFNKYKVGDDLHIGISDSESMVYSYWSRGITVESSSWQDAISIYEFEETGFDETFQAFLDEYSEYFVAEGYEADEWNCFDFIVHFLKLAGVLEKSDANKEFLVANFVTQPLQRAVRYCSLVDRLRCTRTQQLPLLAGHSL